MTWVRPWLLLLLLPVLAWGLWEWRQTRRRGALLLKLLMALLVVLALAQPKLTIWEQRVALALLADTSASIPPEDLRKASDLVAQARGARGRHSLQIIPFAGDARAPGPEETRELRSEGRSTNLEAALRAAFGALPPGRVPRVLLLSDGRENAGSVERALYQARLLGVPVDTYSLEGSRRPALQLESVTLPAQVFTGEKFYIEASLASPRAAAAQVELTAEGRPIGRAEVKLGEGRNTVRVRAQLDAAGATHVSGVIRTPDLGQVRFDRVVSLRHPRLLLVNSDPPEATRHLRQILTAARFDVDESSGALPARLRDYQVIVANNHDVEAWPPAAKTRVEEFVREGGGFGLIAGENNIYVERKPEDEDPLNRMLPAKLAPPRTPEGTAVVLIVDKSSSMEGKKMELARLSAIGVVSNLRSIDQVGVLIFDNSFQWAVPIRKADNPALIKRLIAGITPDGGTQIAPALSEAFRQIRQVKAVYRHIVLLTDGISEEGDSMTTARDAANLQITISTVGLGQDVNRAYLEKVAATAKGKPYFVLELGNLEQLLLRDVMEHTGSSAVEKPVQPAVLREVEILEDTAIAKAPPLLGYLKFIAKPQAETILQVDKDPLLARWQHGLGRSTVFASDAKARWAANWVDWPGFDKLWTNLLRDLLPRAPETEARAEFDQANGEIVVRYRLQAAHDLSGAPPPLYVIGPDNFKKGVPLERLAPAAYQARIPIGDRLGLFRIRPADALDKFPEVGYYREEPELAEYGSNPELLRQIAASTDGRFNPAPRQFFDAGGNSVTTTMELWPGLLALALLCNLLELAARKGYTPARLWRYR
jgi:uncharacterized protein YegL